MMRSKQLAMDRAVHVSAVHPIAKGILMAILRIETGSFTKSRWASNRWVTASPKPICTKYRTL